VIVPSHDLVIVRFGLTHGDAGGGVQMGRLVVQAIEALE
jgi:hypothetical protein